MATLKVSNIDEYISGSARTDVIEIVLGEQKKFVGNLGVDLTNYQFTTKVEFFNATVTYTTVNGTEKININTFNKIATAPVVTRTDIMAVTDAAAGGIEFRIPADIVPENVSVPIDSSTPLIVMITTTINTDTTSQFPIINKETTLLVVRYATR